MKTVPVSLPKFANDSTLVATLNPGQITDEGVQYHFINFKVDRTPGSIITAPVFRKGIADALTNAPGVGWFSKIPVDQFTRETGEPVFGAELMEILGKKFVALIKTCYPSWTGKLKFDTVVRGKNEKTSGKSLVGAVNGLKGIPLQNFSVLNSVSTICTISFWFTYNTKDHNANVSIQIKLEQAKTHKIIQRGSGFGVFKAQNPMALYAAPADDADAAAGDSADDIDALDAAKDEPAAEEQEDRAESALDAAKDELAVEEQEDDVGSGLDDAKDQEVNADADVAIVTTTTALTTGALHATPTKRTNKRFAGANGEAPKSKKTKKTKRKKNKKATKGVVAGGTDGL